MHARRKYIWNLMDLELSYLVDTSSFVRLYSYNSYIVLKSNVNLYISICLFI